MALVGEGSAKRPGLAAAGYGDASASRKKIRAVPPSPLTSHSTENNGEPDGEDAVSEEIVEKDSQSDVQPESDGEDADDEVFMEEEEEEGEGQSAGEYSESDGADVEAEDEQSQAEEEEEEWGECSPEPISPAPSLPRARAGGTVVEDVIVVNSDALECGVCFLPLKAPIFQCERGHVLCSPCRDKLKTAAKCHVCSVATHGYSRCYAMEHLVASILLRCLHAAHGCNARPAYHDRDSHARVCPHSPCLCPDASCSFTGSTTALLDHFATVHGWPCTTKVRSREVFSIRLHDGFNFLGADRAASDDQDAIGSIPPWLFLLNVTEERLGRTISVLGVHPHAAAVSGTNNNCGDDRSAPFMSQCELIFSHYGNSSNGDGAPCRRYYQSSEFQVAWTDLSNGLPNPGLCFQFVVPNSVLGDGKEGIQVKARIVIN